MEENQRLDGPPERQQGQVSAPQTAHEDSAPSSPAVPAGHMAPPMPVPAANGAVAASVRERRWPWFAVTTVALAVVMVVAYLWLGNGAATLTGRAAAAPVYDEDTVIQVYERVNPAVVEVDVSQVLGSSRQPRESAIGTGSGFLVDSDGHIVTNHHVVEGADRARVKFSDGRVVDAKIVGTAPNDDLALLKVDPSAVAGVTPVSLADSDLVKPGQLAIAIGAPYGFDGTVTVGVISGINRSLDSATERPIAGVLQTDAALYPGNSGGPLVNARGEVVGVNTAIRVGSITSIGSGSPSIGFAIPVNNLKQVLPRLLQGGTVGRPFLGISGVPVTPVLQQELGLSVSRGVYVIKAADDGPAQAAGLVGSGIDATGLPKPGGDVITAANGSAVGSVDELAAYLNRYRVGDAVTLSIVRDGQQRTVDVTLAEWPDTAQRPTPTPRPFRVPGGGSR